MTNRRSLGRGLSSLIPDVNEEIKQEEAQKISKEERPEEKEETLDFAKIQSLPIDKVRPRQGQPRTDFDEKSLEDLALSIKEYGLLNPITVTKVDDYYEILAGERRYRASLRNGLQSIDAIVKDYEEKDI